MWSPLRGAVGSAVALLTPDFRGAAGVPLGEVLPSLEVLADDIARLLDQARVDRAIVGGLSMGGYVTMAFARRHRERLAGVVLADTKAGADPEAGRANRLRIAEILESEGTSRVLVDEMMPTFTGSTTKAERAGVAALVADMVGSAAPASAAWWLRAMAARPSSFETLRGLDLPALVIVGDEDATTPVAEAQAMVDALPDARLAVIAKAGHYSAVEAPEEFAAALTEFADEIG